jgi:hypothetical protein
LDRVSRILKVFRCFSVNRFLIEGSPEIECVGR